jgi:hypothetical protein
MQATALLALVGFRLLPFTGYALVSIRVCAMSRLVILFASAATLYSLFRLQPEFVEVLILIAAVYIYFAVLAAALTLLMRALATGWIGRPVLFGTLTIAYLLLPASVVSSQVIIPTILLGWDMLLKAYSFCVDTAWLPTRPSGRERFFFMLVNPVLVYAERGTRADQPKLELGAASRCALGLTAWVADDFLRATAARLTSSSLAIFVDGSVLSAVGYYLAHSGLASFQIGLMRLVGHRIPERYCFPFLAASPIDFWRRWNCWLGAWARRYLFMPASIDLRRRWRHMPATVAQGGGILLTFMLVGALHDLLRTAEALPNTGRIVLSLAATAMFLFFGMLVALSLGIRIAILRAFSIPQIYLRITAHALFIPCVLVMYLLAESTLSGRGLPAPLPSLVLR